MIPIVASLLGSLAQNGLGLLSSAIQAKGKEVVENTLGVKIPDAPTPEDVSKLRQLQFEHEERLMELGIEKAKMELAELDLLAKAAQSDADNVTDRWQADMSSDSWLSKNIRPMSLIAIFLGYFLFALMSAYGYNANESYVTLLGNWGMLVFGAYFGSRTVEKITEIRSKAR
tara:strand:- start:752 stop:1267 length:516 start_codon:yes stop_codon:yes gene_type:complete